MAFNWATFKTRTLTAAVFVVVMFGGLLWNHWSFLLLFSVIHFGCWWEYLKLLEKIHQLRFHHYVKFGLMMMGYGLLTWFTGPGFTIDSYRLDENLSLPLSVAGFALLVIGVFQKNKLTIQSFFRMLWGLLYISLSLGLMVNLVNTRFNNPALNLEWVRYHNPDGWRNNQIFLPLFTILCMWVNDTMAYIIGSLIGKTQLSPISPKKTWEGTIGGIILCAVAMGFLAHSFDEWFLFGQEIMFWIILALGASAVGVCGDLFESKLKRMAGVKDSGHLMPGHGGFLDRFDSLLFATPFVWLFIYFFMQ